MVTSAQVKIWGHLVGVVSWNPQTGLGSFQYAPSFLSVGLDLAPLKMPVAFGKRVFSFQEHRGNQTFKGLPGLLADVLPDHYGSQLIDSWLAQNGREVGSLNPVELLCFIGERGMGALEFVPSQYKLNQEPFDLELDSLVSASKKALQTKQDLHTSLEKGEKEALIEVLKVGTSAGGARPKAIIAYNQTTGEIKSGQTTVPKGFDYWLIKLDGVSDAQFGSSQGYGRVEMAYYLMAKEAGINMMPSMLLEENNRAHFMTKRFDRNPNGEKLHMQTWCAMQHLDFNDMFSFSYEQLFQTMRMLRLSYPEAEEMFRRMTFNVIARNCDDHTKNFAFQMNQHGEWSLAPAYDVCFAYRPGSVWVSRHALSLNGVKENHTRKDLLTVAKAMNIKKAPMVIAQVENAVKNWKAFAKECNVSPELALHVQENLYFLPD